MVVSDRPVLVGASLGGITSLLAETQQPESVAKGLILVDVTPRMETDGVDLVRHSIVAGFGADSHLGPGEIALLQLVAASDPSPDVRELALQLLEA